MTRLFGSANTVRAVLHKQALQILKDTNGLGAGFGMYVSSVSVTTHYSPLYDRYGISSMYGATPENSAFITDPWLAWYLGETGVVGIAVFLLALLIVIVGLWKISLRWYKRRPELAVLGFTAITFLIFGILSGYASVYITAPPTGYFLMGLAGIVFALDRASKRSSNSADLQLLQNSLNNNEH